LIERCFSIDKRRRHHRLIGLDPWTVDRDDAMTGASLRTTGGSTTAGGVTGVGLIVAPPQLSALNATRNTEE
jgi:hypothetical protein